MTDVVPPAVPRRAFNWRATLLIASLALNLVFIGGGVARFFVHERMGRITGISEMQLIPGRFFGDLGASRRAELLAIFKEFRDEFRDGRDARRQLAGVLADALEGQPYDEAKVKDAVQAFTARSSTLIGRGGDAALTFIAKLSGDERHLLAKRIRERSSGGRGGGNRE